MEIFIFLTQSVLSLFHSAVVVLSILSVFVVLFGMRCYNFKTGQCICSDKFIGCDCNKKNN